MIIGAKGLDDQHPFTEAELRELFVGMEQLMKAGMPPEVPAAFPIGQLGRMTITLKRLHLLAANLVKESAEENPNYAPLVEEAKKLLTTPPPLAAPAPQAKSRLILPS
jgi:hypothetical protein